MTELEQTLTARLNKAAEVFRHQKNVIESMTAELEQLKQGSANNEEITILKNEREALLKAFNQKDDTINELKREIEDLKEEANDITAEKDNQLVSFNNDINNYIDLIAKVDAEVVSLREENSKLKEQIENTPKVDVTEYEEKIKTLTESESKLKEENKKLILSNKQINETIDLQKIAIDKFTKNNELHNAETIKMGEEIEQLKEDLTNKTEALKKTENTVSQMQDSLNRDTEKFKDYDKQIEILTDARNNLNQKANEDKLTIEKLNKDIVTYKNDLKVLDQIKKLLNPVKQDIKSQTSQAVPKDLPLVL